MVFWVIEYCDHVINRFWYSRIANGCFKVRLGTWKLLFGFICMYIFNFHFMCIVVSATTCYMLSQVYYYTGSDSYAGMGEALYGRWARITINTIQVLYGLGALFSYTIVAADESHYAMENFIGDIAHPGSFLYWFVGWYHYS